MLRAHQIRMYPTKAQEEMLRKSVGVSRFVYNWALAERKKWNEAFGKGETAERPSANKLSALWAKLKKTEFPWAGEVCACAQQHEIQNVDNAFKNLWKGKAAYPKFHKKGQRDTFYVTNQHGKIAGNRIKLPNIGKVRLAEQLRFTGKIMSYTISTYAGQWHVSVQVETDKDERPQCANPESVVGIDVGLKHIATASDGAILDSPKSLEKLTKKLKWEQRKLSRKQHKSHNYQKQLLRKQKVQLKINNIRKDLIHKFTTAITKNHGIVKVEDLNVKGMMEKAPKSLRHSLATSLMREVLSMLEMKAQHLVKVDRFFPSSKRCSKCGHVKLTLGLDERTYVCDECGFTIDRDMNAAVNLMNYSGKVIPGEPVDSIPRSGAEAGSTMPELG